MAALFSHRKTVEICRQLEKLGVSYLTVHARQSHQTTGEINVESLKLIQDATNIPVIANGGIKYLKDCELLQEETNCRGVMVANGILANPTLFTGSNVTSTKCIQDWLNICYNSTLSEGEHSYITENNKITKPTILQRPYNLTFQMFHHHLVFMLEKLLPKRKRQVFNNYKTFKEVLDFIENEFGICPKLFTPEEYISYKLLNLNYDDNNVYDRLRPVDIDDMSDVYDYSASHGKYFESKLESASNETSECDWAELFLDSG